MTQKNGADRPDDYKRFSEIDKNFDFNQTLHGNPKSETLDKNEQTNNKEEANENMNVAGRYFEPADYKGSTQLEQGLAETHEQVSDDYFEGTIDQNLD
ncbi:YozQ family protein [Bacillus mojavensis]|uniref:YozQ family protein n=1 Tax=Bacillus mojavensis TaxID=72360 RepID=UPI002DB57FA0|nr:YozQ family protein [Bacillus mojavensis]MEC1670558.1 YozQ family protein [Bacillus mojavensis]